MSTRKKALIVCPGRGTYNKPELGYLKTHHADKQELITEFDSFRKNKNQTPVSELDNLPRYSLATHTRGDNASPLIYACAYSDFLSINKEKYDVVGVTGNSMGWYIALVIAGALTPIGGMEIINTMGTLMQETLIGGQVIYPLVDKDWQEIEGRRTLISNTLKTINERANHQAYVSIELGGFIVLAGNDNGVKALLEILPSDQDRFPMTLQNHAAFHTILQEGVAQSGRQILGSHLFKQPQTTLIDGRGNFWRPHATTSEKLWQYTLDQQVVKTYDFTKAISVSVQELAPDCIIVLGPGNTLGGAVAQSLIPSNLAGFDTKNSFIHSQQKEPFILSMGLEEQRRLISK